jgi:hypothetical protein
MVDCSEGGDDNEMEEGADVGDDDGGMEGFF